MIKKWEEERRWGNEYPVNSGNQKERPAKIEKTAPIEST